jgi:hypothetical protein
VPAPLGQRLRNRSFELPEGGGVADNPRALAQPGEAGGVGRTKVPKAGLGGRKLEVLAAECQGEDFFVAQGGSNAAAASRVGVFAPLRVLPDHTVDSHDKLSAIPWDPPAVNSSCGSPYSTKKVPNGLAAQELHIRF